MMGARLSVLPYSELFSRGENFHEFRGLTSIREHFPLENI